MLTYTSIVENAIKYGVLTPLQIAQKTNESCENVEHAICELLLANKIKRLHPKFEMFVSIEAKQKTVIAKTLKKRYRTTAAFRHKTLQRKLKKHRLPETTPALH